MSYATTKTFTPKLGPQEPPEDHRIFNRRLPNGTRRPVSEFFDRAVSSIMDTKIDEKHYDEGYKAGHADKLLGRTLITARDSQLPGYAEGYLAGQGDAIREKATA